MTKKCSICGREAAFGVIDKIGFMDPGTLCPSDYLTWKDRPGADWFIFQPLPDSEAVMRAFVKKRGVRSQEEEEPGLIEIIESRGLSMEEIKFDAILAAYESNGHNAQAACRELKISKATFYREMKRHNYGMDRKMTKKETEL